MTSGGFGAVEMEGEGLGSWIVNEVADGKERRRRRKKKERQKKPGDAGEEKEEGADMATKVLTWKPRGKISAK